MLTVLCAVTAYFIFDIARRPVTHELVGTVVKPDGEQAVVLLSDTYLIDRIYQSMQGPYSTQEGISLIEDSNSELLWITGLEVQVVGKNGKKKMSDEFFCHANLTFDERKWSPEKHNLLFKNQTSLDSRLITLVPGRMQIALPKGFGIPISSSEELNLFSMSLNQNVENAKLNIRFKSSIDFVADRAATQPMKALFLRSIYGYVPIQKAGAPDAICSTLPPELSKAGVPVSGASCVPPGVNASLGGIRKNGEVTLHWMVPPGRHIYRTDVTDQLKLGFETTIHYVTGHLHPFGELITVRNKTTDQMLFEIKSQDHPEKKSVTLMEEFKLEAGIPVNPQDEYELVITYNNPTDKPTDAMGIVYLYLLDRNFDKEQQAKPSTSGKTTLASAMPVR